MTFQNKLLEIVKLEATNLWPDVNLPEFEITTPPNPEFGDLSIALPLPVAKLLEANPIDIAEKLKEALAKREIEHINKVTVTNPGFVNFVIDFPSLSKTTLKKVLSQKENYGKNRLDMGQVIIEHTSVNPNKAVHVGHLRNACLGDSLVRIMRSSGFEVETQNYIDDTGAQVADIIVAQEHLPDEQKKDEPFDYYCWDIYTKIQKFYEADEKLVERKKEVLKLIEEGNNETSQKASEIANKVINRHLKTFSRLNVAYDLLVWERDIIDVGLWPSVFEKLKTEKLIENPTHGDYKDTWLVRFGFNTRDDKILVKSDGTATYTAKDLAYEMWKFSLLDIDFPYFTRGTQYNKQPLTTTKGGIQEKSEDTTRNIPKPVKVFTLIDERQEYPRQVIKYTLEQLGYKDEAKNSIHVGYGVVRLSRNALEDLGITPKEKKESYAMSGRSGIGVKIDDLMDKTEEKIAEINPELSEEDVKTLSNATIRYYMLRNRINKEAIFDFAEALKTDGNTGVYLEYAYARCCNILNKINALPSFDDITPPQDLDQTNKNLISLLENYPSQIEKSSQVCDPSLLTDYAFSIASAFAKFYETNPVLKAQSIELKIFRIQMVAATKEVLGNILNLLGISPLTKI